MMSRCNVDLGVSTKDKPECCSNQLVNYYCKFSLEMVRQSVKRRDGQEISQYTKLSNITS